MKKLFVLLILVKLKANMFAFKTYSIPGTNLLMEVPKNWHECINTDAYIQLCKGPFWPNLTLTMHKDISAKKLFIEDLSLVTSQARNTVYGKALIGKTYWLDYGHLGTNGKNFRSFRIFSDINDNDSIEIDYQFYDQNITGFVLEKFQASLESLRTKDI